MALTPEILLHGYSIGVFPMAERRDDPEVFWVDPRKRGIMPLDGFHMSRSLARAMRNTAFTLSLNRAFAQVVDGCADRPETWINAEIWDLYLQLHDQGSAHSLEIWEKEELVGGIYGVTLGAAFFGESMFSRRTNASKMALAACVDRLHRGGFHLFDTQFVTPHLLRMGAVEISRAAYHNRLAHAIKQNADFVLPDEDKLQDVVQRMTQMS